MVELAQEYLALRRQLGYALTTSGQTLLSFSRYADSIGHTGPITIDLAARWAKLPQGARPYWWARRLQVVRGFAQHRSLFEPGTEISPADLLGPHFRRSTPHIYSDAEISALLQTKDLGPARGLRCHSYVTLFGLLITSGLRVSEALHLQRDEVDLQSGVLTVARSKFRKSRLVPLHPSTTHALAKYAERRHRYHPEATARTFFINERGAPMGYSGVIGTFTDLRRQLGWTKNREGRRPRLHDMRHTMAVRTLLRWYQQGAEVDQKILALCTYLGHVEVTDTYWYLTAVPELMALTAARFQAYSRHHSRRGR
jgi:site-specific recombinase XerD